MGRRAFALSRESSGLWPRNADLTIERAKQHLAHVVPGHPAMVVMFGSDIMKYEFSNEMPGIQRELRSVSPFFKRVYSEAGLAPKREFMTAGLSPQRDTAVAAAGDRLLAKEKQSTGFSL